MKSSGWFLLAAIVVGAVIVMILVFSGTFISPKSTLREDITPTPPEKAVLEGFARSQPQGRIPDATAVEGAQHGQESVDLSAVPVSYPFDPEVGLPALSGMALSCGSAEGLLPSLRADPEVHASGRKLDLAAVERALKVCRESIELYKQACAVYEAGYLEWRRRALAAGTVRRFADENKVRAFLESYKGRDKTAVNLARIHMAEPEDGGFIVAVADPHQDLMLYISYANVSACGATVADCVRRSALEGN